MKARQLNVVPGNAGIELGAEMAGIVSAVRVLRLGLMLLILRLMERRLGVLGKW